MSSANVAWNQASQVLTSQEYLRVAGFPQFIAAGMLFHSSSFFTIFVSLIQSHFAHGISSVTMTVIVFEAELDEPSPTRPFAHHTLLISVVDRSVDVISDDPESFFCASCITEQASHHEQLYKFCPDSPFFTVYELPLSSVTVFDPSDHVVTFADAFCPVEGISTTIVSA